MVLTVVKVGEGLAIPLPDEAVALLELREGSDVDVTLDPDRRQVRLAAADPAAAGIDAEFARQLDVFIAHYRPALLALAR